MQYFYIVLYTIVGDDMTMCKIGLNPHQLISVDDEKQQNIKTVLIGYIDNL